MKLRRCQSPSDPKQLQIEALINQTWLPLSLLDNLADIAQEFRIEGNLATDMLAVLAMGEAGWSILNEKLLEKLNSYDQTENNIAVKPFQPSSFREFTLFEKHYTSVARAHVKRFMPAVFPITGFYEKLTGKTFPLFKPSALWYQQPIYYYGSHLNFYTDNDLIPWPNYIEHLDYELELAAIISKEVRDASPATAKDAIGGYVLINDFSSRGAAQKIEMDSGCGPQKSKHFANSMSSVVITADEIAGLEDKLKGEVLINGLSVSHCCSEGMQFSFAEIVEFVSAGQTLYPGELLASGTLPGGSGLECNRLLSPGDHLTLKLENVGELNNFIDRKKIR